MSVAVRICSVRAFSLTVAEMMSPTRRSSAPIAFIWGIPSARSAGEEKSVAVILVSEVMRTVLVSVGAGFPGFGYRSVSDGMVIVTVLPFFCAIVPLTAFTISGRGGTKTLSELSSSLFFCSAFFSACFAPDIAPSRYPTVNPAMMSAAATNVLFCRDSI